MKGALIWTGDSHCLPLPAGQRRGEPDRAGVRVPGDRHLAGGAQGPQDRVAVTALAGVEDRRRLLAAGFQAHIAKPFDGLQLIAVARFVADRRQGA